MRGNLIFSQESFSYCLYLICVHWEGANVIDFQLLLIAILSTSFRLSLIYRLCERVLRQTRVIGYVSTRALRYWADSSFRVFSLIC